MRIRKETLQGLKEIGHKGESYDDIIRKLLARKRRSWIREGFSNE